jgi:CheY-like chemotaxis protein
MARLLLIDDDEFLRAVIAVALTAVGHTVLEAADGRLAFAHSDIDLVITDLVMPDREGLETIATLHRQRPALPIIAISGDVANSKLYLETAIKLGARRALTKPFASAMLLGVIDELLTPPLAPPAARK